MNLLKELITAVKDTSLQTRISQLETSTMIVSNLNACHCDSMKPVQINTKKHLHKTNSSDFREV